MAQSRIGAEKVKGKQTCSLGIASTILWAFFARICWYGLLLQNKQKSQDMSLRKRKYILVTFL
jgi:hypothetical protein